MTESELNRYIKKFYPKATDSEIHSIFQYLLEKCKTNGVFSESDLKNALEYFISDQKTFTCEAVDTSAQVSKANQIMKMIQNAKRK